MAFSKSTLYPRNLQLLAHQLKALSYPARLEILQYLNEKGPRTVHEIAEGHPISEEALSGHLKILRVAQLVMCDERYPYTFYRLHHSNFKKAILLLKSFFALFDDQDT